MAQQRAALRDAIPGLNQGFLNILNIMQLRGTPSVLFHVRPQDPRLSLLRCSRKAPLTDFLKISCIEFHENATDYLVDSTRTWCGA